MKLPKIINILLTYQCNLHCSFCWQNRYRYADELTLIQVTKILDEAYCIGIKNVNFWGGEPLLHKDIFKMIDYAKSLKMRCFIITNGLLVEKYAENIVNSGLDFLQISIDGLADQHDTIRSYQSLFIKIENGIKKVNRLKRIFPLISSATVILPNNYNILEQLVSYNFSIGFEAAFLQFLMAYNRKTIDMYKRLLQNKYGIEIDSIIYIDQFEGYGLNKKQFEAVCFQSQNMLAKWSNKVSIPTILKLSGDYKFYIQTEGSYPKDMTLGCQNLLYKVNIMPNGDMVMCPDFPDFKIGNIFDSSLLQLWNSDHRLQFVSDFYAGHMLPICSKCCQLWEENAIGGFKGLVFNDI